MNCLILKLIIYLFIYIFRVSIKYRYNTFTIHLYNLQYFFTIYFLKKQVKKYFSFEKNNLI